MAAVGFYFGRPLQSSLPKAMQQMYCLVIPHSVAAGIAIFKLRSFTSSLDQGPCVCRVALEDRIRRWSLYRVSKGTQVRKLHYVIDYVPASKRATCAWVVVTDGTPKKKQLFWRRGRKDICLDQYWGHFVCCKANGKKSCFMPDDSIDCLSVLVSLHCSILFTIPSDTGFKSILATKVVDPCWWEIEAYDLFLIEQSSIQ